MPTPQEVLLWYGSQSLSDKKQNRLQQRTAEKQQKLSQNDLNQIYTKGAQQRFDALGLLNTQGADLISRTMNADGTGNIFGEDKPLGLNVERAVRDDHGYFGRPLSDTRGIGGDSIYQRFNNPQDDSDYNSKYPEGEIPTNFQPAILDKVTDMDTLQFRGVTGGVGGVNKATGERYDLTGKPTGDRQVGVDAFEVPHEGNEDYLNSGSGSAKLIRQHNALINLNTSPKPNNNNNNNTKTASEILGVNGEKHNPLNTITGIAGATFGGVLNTASMVSSAPKKLYEFLGGNYLEDKSTYSTAIKGIIDTMDDGAKLIDKFNDSYVNVDKKSQDKFAKSVGKSFDDGNYLTGIIGAVIDNPVGAIETGAYSWGFGKAITAKGLAKVPGFLGATIDNVDQANEEFKKVNHRDSDAEEKGIIAVLSLLNTAVDSKAADIALKGVKGDKFLNGLSTIVDKAIDKLPTETLNRLIFKPAVHMAGRMTAEGIQEGPIQQGLQHIAANQNDLSKLQDRVILKDIYVNGIIGAISVHGMRTADIGNAALSNVTGAIKDGKSNELIDKAKGMVESAKDKAEDIVSAPEDVANAVATNHPTPITDKINSVDVKEGISMMRSLQGTLEKEAAAANMTPDEYHSKLDEGVRADMDSAFNALANKAAEQAAKSGKQEDTDMLGATPEQEHAIIAAYSNIDDDEQAKVFEANMAKRNDKNYANYDPDIAGIMEKAKEARKVNKELSSMDQTRKGVLLTGIDTQKKGLKQYFNAALRSPAGSVERNNNIEQMTRFAGVQEAKADKLSEGKQTAINEIGTTINKIESKTKLPKNTIWKAIVYASGEGKSSIANGNDFKIAFKELESKGYTKDKLSVAGKMTKFNYASNTHNRLKFGRQAGDYEINHPGALIDYAKEESIPLDGINETWKSGSRVNDVINAIDAETEAIHNAIALINKNTARKSQATNTSSEAPTEPVEPQTNNTDTNTQSVDESPSRAPKVTPTTMQFKDPTTNSLFEGTLEKENNERAAYIVTDPTTNEPRTIIINKQNGNVETPVNPNDVDLAGTTYEAVNNSTSVSQEGTIEAQTNETGSTIPEEDKKPPKSPEYTDTDKAMEKYIKEGLSDGINKLNVKEAKAKAMDIKQKHGAQVATAYTEAYANRIKNGSTKKSSEQHKPTSKAKKDKKGTTAHKNDQKASEGSESKSSNKKHLGSKKSTTNKPEGDKRSSNTNHKGNSKNKKDIFQEQTANSIMEMYRTLPAGVRTNIRHILNMKKGNKFAKELNKKLEDC